MMNFIWTCAAFASGFFAYIMYWRGRTIISTRINYGRPIKLNGEKIGRIVTMRFNGSKRYVFVDYDGTLRCDKQFWNAEQATEAVKKAYINIIQKKEVQEDRPLRRAY